MNLIPVPPDEPSLSWLAAFAAHLMIIKPDLPLDKAERCARLAHAGTWLLPPQEAAGWWLAAIEASARHRTPKGLRG